MKRNEWFSVDKEGLAAILERRGKHFAIFELIQNAWDEDTTKVDIILEPIPGKPYCELRVEDDSSEGFRDLADAHTLFAPSYKKGDAEKRGRFNLGEKLVLAICKNALITSTTGTVFFNEDGTRTRGKAKTTAGTIFKATIRMTREEHAEACEMIKRLIPPYAQRRLQKRPEIHTIFNGDAISERRISDVFGTALPTEIADHEGNLRRTTRKTSVVIYGPRKGEPAMIYEMGIPVCELPDDSWHVDVMQKVPLNLERDSVTPAYLKKIRTIVLNEMHMQLDEEQVNSAWAQEATSDPNCTDEAMESYVETRFGDKVVAFDPSDPEANKAAVSAGYTVIHGRNLSKPQWDNVRRAGLAPAASTKFKTSMAQFGADGEDVTYPEDKWTPEMHATRNHFERVARRVLGVEVAVDIIKSRQGFAACYGSRAMKLNIRALGKDWFTGPLCVKHDLLIHELAHDMSGDHLDKKYYQGLSKIGALLTDMALNMPNEFTEDRTGSPRQKSVGVPS